MSMFKILVNALLKYRASLEECTEKSVGFRKKIVKVACKPFKKLTDGLMYALFRYHKSRILRHIPALPTNSTFTVSLTSFPKRMDDLWMVLWSVYNQTILPCRVILSLTKEEFPLGLTSLPDSVKVFMNKGLEIVFNDINLKPHNKYYYALSHIKDQPVITVDDDFIYYLDSFERLLRLHRDYPDCVCANRVQRIGMDGTEYLSYNCWKLVHDAAQGEDLVALGYACVLYPSSFRPAVLFDLHPIQTLSLRADDLWLKAVEVVTKTPVIKGDYYAYPFQIPKSQIVSLRLTNNDVRNPQNDPQWKNLVEYFNITGKDIKRTDKD